MLLQDENAVIYGGGGAIGGAVARACAHEGANVFLAGRTPAKLEHVAREISDAGAVAETAALDALDERAVDGHAVCGAVLAGLRASDRGLHANELPHREGGSAAHGEARLRRDSHVVNTGIAHAGHGFIGYGVTCGAIETFSRILAG